MGQLENVCVRAAGRGRGHGRASAWMRVRPHVRRPPLTSASADGISSGCAFSYSDTKCSSSSSYSSSSMFIALPSPPSPAPAQPKPMQQRSEQLKRLAEAQAASSNYLLRTQLLGRHGKSLAQPALCALRRTRAPAAALAVLGPEPQPQRLVPGGGDVGVTVLDVADAADHVRVPRVPVRRTCQEGAQQLGGDTYTHRHICLHGTVWCKDTLSRRFWNQ